MSSGVRRLDDPIRWDETGNPTHSRRDVIIDAVGSGLPEQIAAQAAGIPRMTMRNWLEAGRAGYQRTLTDPDAAVTDEEAALVQFATDIDQAQGEWFRNANEILDGVARETRLITTRTSTDAKGVVTTTETTKVGPGDAASLMWRMGKVSPSVFGAQRIELTGAEGRPVEVDIGAKLDELVGSIRAALSTGEPTASNGHEDGGT